MIHKAKKSMGQNFLKSKPALAMMCEAGDVRNTDTIVEIGPGKGALTEKLLEKARHIIAIEKDRDLVAYLQEKFVTEIQNKKLELIEGDILNYELRIKNYKLVANIPYNITGAIIKKFLTADIQPERMVLLVQKEVAERIVARDNKESVLSISVKVYGTPKYMMKVGKRFFSPAPKVDSAIIAITNISKGNFEGFPLSFAGEGRGEVNFFQLVKAGFAHKRKVLRKNLEEVLEKSDIDAVFEELNINPKARAEDIRIETWLKIAKYTEKA